MTPYLSQWTPAKLLLASFLLGIGLSAFSALFRIRRRLTRGLGRRLSAVLLSLEDVLFFLVAAIACALTFYAISNGEVRMLGLVGIPPGFILWRMTAGRLLMAFLDRILALLARIARFLWRRIALPPVRWISLAVAAGMGRLARFFRIRAQKRYTKSRQKRAIAYARRGFQKP